MWQRHVASIYEWGSRHPLSQRGRLGQGGTLGTMGTDPERVVYLNTNASSELLFLWNESEVPILQQYQLTIAGFKNVRKFVSLDDTKVAVRAAVAADLTLDPTARAGDRLIIATIVAAWEIAKEQLGREIQLRAEAKTLNIARPMGNSERTGMKRVLEEQYGKIGCQRDSECRVPQLQTRRS